MQLLLVLAIVTAVSISEYAPHQPVPDAGMRLVLAVLAMAIAPLFAAATSSLIAESLRRDFGRKSDLLRWFGRLRGIHSFIWFVVAGVVLHQLGWVRVVRFNWHLDGTFLLDDLLIFLPIIVPLVLSWAAFYEVERSLHRAASEDSSSMLVTRSQYLSLHARHYLGLLFVPVLCVLAVQDVIQYVGPALPGESEAFLLLLPIGGLLLFFPLVLRGIWNTEPLPAGELRDRLTTFSGRAGFKAGELFTWRTDRMMVNAAVVGLLRPWRYVFFTDALLARFSSDEIEAVLGHEIGHVRRHHLFERILVMALPVALWFAFARMFPAVTQQAVHWFAGYGLSAEAQAAIAGPVGLAIYAVTLFALHARLLEYDADLFAARTCDPTSNLSQTGSERMAALLEKLALVSGMDRRARSWLHPTIADRVLFLEQVANDPKSGEKFERRMRVSHRVLFVLFAAMAVYLVVTSA